MRKSNKKTKTKNIEDVSVADVGVSPDEGTASPTTQPRTMSLVGEFGASPCCKTNPPCGDKEERIGLQRAAKRSLLGSDLEDVTTAGGKDDITYDEGSVRL